MGHGVGLSLHDRPFIQLALQKQNPNLPPVELKEGMVIALETWYGRPGSRDGVRLEDMVVVTKDGYDLLCPFPHRHSDRCVEEAVNTPAVQRPRRPVRRRGLSNRDIL